MLENEMSQEARLKEFRKNYPLTHPSSLLAPITKSFTSISHIRPFWQASASAPLSQAPTRPEGQDLGRCQCWKLRRDLIEPTSKVARRLPHGSEGGLQPNKGQTDKGIHMLLPRCCFRKCLLYLLIESAECVCAEDALSELMVLEKNLGQWALCVVMLTVPLPSGLQ